MLQEPQRILLIRRDNIGDLVLTTPLIHALRMRFLNAWIGVLGNSYNTPALANHPDVDAVFAYDKAKHRPAQARLAVYAGTARLLWRLRTLRVDLCVLAGPGPQLRAARLARWIKAREILGFCEHGTPPGLTIPLPYGAGAALHEAEDVFRLGEALGVSGPAGPCRIAADAGEQSRCGAMIQAAGLGERRVIAVHLSARRPRQRWPAQRFAALMTVLHQRHSTAFVLLWAPGNQDDPRHPGDDAKADAVRGLLADAIPCVAWPTHSLKSLIGAIACCDMMVCADGGAMHVATGLHVPVVALFGDSPAQRWRPWGVRAEVLQAASGNVADLEVPAVADACDRILANT